MRVIEVIIDVGDVIGTFCTLLTNYVVGLQVIRSTDGHFRMVSIVHWIWRVDHPNSLRRDDSFNSITGLNGSGKSNILDAICFVLGITNMSTVRAQNLQVRPTTKGHRQQELTQQ